MTAPATILTSIGRVYFDENSTSFCRFVEHHPKETRPCRITNAFGKAMIMEHPIYMQIFDADNAVAVNYFTGMLMRKVISFELNTFMHSGNDFALFTPFLSPFFGFSKLALGFSQFFFFTPKEARIFNFGSIGKGSKGFKTDINTYRIVFFGQSLRFNFNREANVPFASARPGESSSFSLSFNWTVLGYFEMAYFGNIKPAVLKIAPTRHLGESETIVPTKTFEAGVAGFFTGLNPTEKGFDAQIYPHRYILQKLAMHTSKGWPKLFFQVGKGSLLFKTGDIFAVFFISGFTFSQKVIEQPATLFQGAIKQAALLFGRVNSKLKCFEHSTYYCLK